MSPLLKGFLIALGLMTALGPKDAFVIRQSLYGQHLRILFFLCVASDCLLVIVGVLGLGAIIQSHPYLMNLAVLGGVIFMLWQALVSFRLAVTPAHPFDLDAPPDLDRNTLIRDTLMMSLGNPLAVADLLVIFGAISTIYTGNDRWSFSAGAVLASSLWFAFLIVGARLMSPLFKKDIMWRIMDGLISFIMLLMAGFVIVDFFNPQ